jgi:hypothetical protein
MHKRDMIRSSTTQPGVNEMTNATTQTQKSIAELKVEFSHYFADLKDDAKRNDYKVNKADEWDRFLEKQKKEII